MSFIPLTPVDRDQVLRYMGNPPDRADEALRDLVARADVAVREAAQPRWHSCVFPLPPAQDGLSLPGRDLAAHLSGCDRAVVLCATLGAQVDTLIRAAQCTDLLYALALDCCASALIEQLCDRAEEEVQRTFPGCYFPYRYSPGYGDLPMEVNATLLQLVDAPIRLGLCATPSMLLTPRKSVTAILGVSPHPIDKSKRSCLGCSAHESCQFRKTGGHCGIL